MEIITKIGKFFDALNTSTVWAYIQSAVKKLVALLAGQGEAEAADIIDIIFKGE
jgi:hypothetical protein